MDSHFRDQVISTGFVSFVSGKLSVLPQLFLVCFGMFAEIFFFNFHMVHMSTSLLLPSLAFRRE